MTDTIQKILIPTDFGELGGFAYSIAEQIAIKSGATIDVMSVVNGPSGAFYSPTGALTNDEGNDYTEWTRKLESSKEKMEEWVADKSHIASTYSVIGQVDSCIMTYASDHSVDLIVMGTAGLFDHKVWSKPSHAQYICNHSEVPVLTLKCDRSLINVDQMLLAGDFFEAKKIDLGIVKYIQKLFGAELYLLTIRTGEAKRTLMDTKADMDAFAKANELSNYTLHIYEDSSIEAGIGKFAASEKIDLIALGTHQKSGFAKLFGGSVSDDVVNHLFHPILTFPIA